MRTPLYQGYNQPRDPQKNLSSHKGLWFERFFNKYDRDWGVGDTDKKSWIDTVTGTCGDSARLQSNAISQSQLCEQLAGKSQIFKNNWHFITGMGNNHPVENGMSWHPTLGTPYLSGASVKGLLRSWMEEWSDLEEGELKKKLYHWFGSDDKDPKEQQQESQAGALIFFDAVPVTPVTLACDIMTPHMGKWYSDGSKIQESNYAETLPADWHNPIIINFLVVKQANLQFSIAPRPHADITQDDCDEAMQMLTMALEYLGAGAKTATGYGRFEIDKETEKKQEKIQNESLRAKMNPEDRFVDELKSIEEKQLAEMFGKGFNKTQKLYEEQNCNWDEILKILLKEKRALIESWVESEKKTAQGRAYNKLKHFL